MKQITFEDKVTLNEDPSINETNKITAENMNEIKRVVNEIVGEGLSQLISEIILTRDKAKYYIGSLIFDTKNINPSTYLGFGTWELWGSGRVPVGVDTSQTEFNTVEKTGGAKTHTLNINEMPRHSHPNGIGWGDGSMGNEYGKVSTNSPNKLWGNGQEGWGVAHNNLQPYITCYMWKRTS